jgi:hypothetical protein
MTKIEPQKAIIRGLNYTLLTKRMRVLDGHTDLPPTRKGEIWIRNSLTGMEMLDTLVHEFLHVAFPDLSEDAVLEVARDIAVILWDLGYRADWDE